MHVAVRSLRIVVVAVAASLLCCGPASAIVPGANGKIAFDSDRDGDFNVYTIEPDGSALARLTSSEEHESDPAWSPDARRIAYVRDFELWMMNPDGTDQRQVTRRMAQVSDVS